jgi:hypothetical protein
MSPGNIRLIALLVALVLLVGINTAAVVARVTVQAAAAGNAVAALTAVIGLLAGDRGPQPPST